ncbi:YihY/virulence factor BrkB family protein [Halegenticoccus tardaugens]|uniref:YihY/virulence factor BrkB family protein n=1 Tax=Halegenticoccus tardaugens TaxID=2071624 RepID=UPI00100B320B|nr:YihY/virulence factor BrkB family protein [Halegenticoccus tardaugens]
MRTDDAVDVVRAIFRESRRHNLPFLAGSLAFHAFVSLLPLLLLLVVVASAVAGDALAAYVVELTRTYLSPAGRQLVADAVLRASEQTGGSILGLAVLAWSTVRVFWGIDVAFTRLYDAVGEKSVGRQLRDGAIGMSVVGLAVAAVVLAGSAFAFLPRLPFAGLVNPVFLLVGLTVAFFPLYYMLPPVAVSAREVVPGTLVAAVGWAVFETLFQVYVSIVTSYSAYGAIGSVLVLLIWLYSGSLIVLLGAVVNVVLGGRTEETDAKGDAIARSPFLR